MTIVVSSCWPNVGSTLGGGNPLLIRGSGLTGFAGTITVKGVTAPGYTVIDDTSITVPLPVGTAGVGDVVVGGVGAGNNLFRYWDPGNSASTISWFHSEVGVTGAPVSAWADQVGGANNLAAIAGQQPSYVANAFGTQHGLQYTAGTHIMTTIGVVTMSVGLTYFVVLKTTDTRITPVYQGDGANNLIGDTTGSVVNELGLGTNATVTTAPGVPVYNQYVGGWSGVGAVQPVNTGRPVLVGVTHNATTGAIVLYRGAEVIATGNLTYDTTLNEWNAVGGGFNTADWFGGTIGAVIIGAGVMSAADIAILNVWAQQQFGTFGFAALAGAADANTAALPPQPRILKGVAALTGAVASVAYSFARRVALDPVALPPRPHLSSGGAGVMLANGATAQGAGLPSNVARIIVPGVAQNKASPFMLRVTPELPPRVGMSNGGAGVMLANGATAQGAGLPSNVARTFVAVTPAPFSGLPPADSRTAGVVPAAPPPVAALVSTPVPALAALPPATAIAAGFGTYPAVAVLAVGAPPPALASLPPLASVSAGVVPGVVPGVAAVFGVPVPAFAALPPATAIAAGFGTYPAVAVLAVGAPPPALAALPPATAIAAGFGTFPAIAVIRVGAPPPALAALPPATAIAAGFGTYPAVAVLAVGAPPPALAMLPPVTRTAAGVPPPPPVGAGTVYVATPPAAAQLPPTDKISAGFGTYPAVAAVFGVPVPAFAALPPATAIAAGFGSFPAIATLAHAFLLPPATSLPPATEINAGANPPVAPIVPTIVTAAIAPTPVALPPQDRIAAGFGSFPAIAVLAVGAPPPVLAALPPATAIAAGFGTYPAVAVLAVGAPPPALASLPPQDAVIRGFGTYPAVASLLSSSGPFAPLPPKPYVLKGFGFIPQTVALYTAPLVAPTPYALPPTDALIKGVRPPIGAGAIFYGSPPPVLAPLPPQPDINAGFGSFPALAAMPAAAVVSAPFATLPPPVRVITGFGSYPAVAVLAVGMPPPVLALLPPQPDMNAGFGTFPALAVVLAAVVPPPFAGLPPTDRVIIGFGDYPQIAVIRVGAPPPVLAGLPPQAKVAIGSGSFPAIAVVLAGAPPAPAQLPPLSVIRKGFGSFPAIATLTRATVPAPAAALPPSTLVARGIFPVPFPGAIHPFLIPPSAELPPLSRILHAFFVYRDAPPTLRGSASDYLQLETRTGEYFELDAAASDLHTLNTRVIAQADSLMTLLGGTEKIDLDILVDGVYVDPNSLTCTVMAPTGVSTTYTLGSSPELLARHDPDTGDPLVGRYRVVVPCGVLPTPDPNLIGKWLYRWDVDTGKKGCKQGSFTVSARDF